MRRLQALALSGIGPARHRHAVDRHLAAGGRQQTDDHARHRRLAGAGFAHEREGLAPVDGEGYAIDRLQILLLAAFQHPVEPGLGDVEDAAQVFDFDKRTLGHATASDRTLD